MTSFNAREYALEMRRLEERRNVAHRQGDGAAVRALLERAREINRAFFAHRG